MKSLVVALQFLTRFPFDGKRKITERNLAESTAFFPLVGLFLGCVLAVIYIVLFFYFSPAVVNAVILIALIWMSSALHLDGFTDTADGLYGKKSIQERLRIMRSSTVGAIGVVAVVCLLLLKLLLLNEISITYKLQTLILFPAIGRWAMVAMMPLFPYARKQGTGKFTELVGLKEVATATIIALFFSILLFGFGALLIMPCVFAAAYAISAHISKQIGGMTGDSYGALNETMEVVCLAIIALLL